MGLIKAAVGAAGGVMADQWKEFFYCESMPKEVLVTKGVKRTSGRSSNTRGSDNIITSGSGIAVADGQCMMIVEQGRVVELCAEPGEFTYDASSEPSVFSGSLSAGIKNTFAQIGKRFTYGGDAGKDQRVYYFNTKELIDNKFGTPNPIPFRVVDNKIGLDVDVSVRCSGVYSYRIADPLLFYTNVCGNVEQEYTRDELDSWTASSDSVYPRRIGQPAETRVHQRFAAGVRQAFRPRFASEPDCGTQHGAGRRHEYGAFREMGRAARLDGRQHCAWLRDTAGRGRRDDQAGTAHGDDARPDYGGGHARRRTVGRDENGRGQLFRCYERLYGRKYGYECGRHERTGAVRHGSAAGGAGCGQLEVRVRHGGQRQFLPELRGKEAG